MKKIGIVGGAGPEAGALLFQNIIRIYQQQGCWRDHEFPLINLLSYPFAGMVTVEEAQQNKQDIASQLQSAIDTLEDIPVDVIAIACNTLHMFAPMVKFKHAKFISIVASTVQEIKSCDVKKALFLGTATSAAGNLYADPAIEFLYPSDEQQKEVSAAINRVMKNEASASDARMIEHIIQDIKQKNTFEAVVLGCTELPIIHQKYPINVGDLHLFDTVEILAERLVV